MQGDTTLLLANRRLFATVYDELSRDWLQGEMCGFTGKEQGELNQRDVSRAKAVGLMQVTPEAKRDTAKRFSITYETRNYVQRVMENLQVYRGRFGETKAATSEPDLAPKSPKKDPRIPICNSRFWVKKLKQ